MYNNSTLATCQLVVKEETPPTTSRLSNTCTYMYMYMKRCHGGARQASCFELINREHAQLVWLTTRYTRRTRALPHVHLTTGIQWLGCWLISSPPFFTVTCFSFLIIIHLCNSPYSVCRPLLIAIVRNAVVFHQQTARVYIHANPADMYGTTAAC